MREDVLRWLPTLAIAAAAGYACAWLRTPIPWMIGPLFSVALLRVAGAPGETPVNLGGGHGAGTPARGWVPIPANTGWDFSANKTLFIVQHPRADSRSLSASRPRARNRRASTTQC